MLNGAGSGRAFRVLIPWSSNCCLMKTEKTAAQISYLKRVQLDN